MSGAAVERPEDQVRAGLSLARYAEISAEIRALGRARLGEILSRAGVSTEDWEKADASWKAAIDADLDGKAALLLAFAARFSAARRQLTSSPVSGGAEARAPAPPIVPEPTPEVEERLPTFLIDSPDGLQFKGQGANLRLKGNKLEGDGTEITLEAGSRLRLVCGASTIEMLPGGINISTSGVIKLWGGMILLN